MPPRQGKKSGKETKKRQVKKRSRKRKRKPKVKEAVKKVELKEQPLPALSKLKSCSWDWQTKRLEGLMDGLHITESQEDGKKKKVKDPYLWSLVFKPTGSKVDLSKVWGSRDEIGSFVPDISGVYVFAPHTEDTMHYTYTLKRHMIVGGRNGENETKLGGKTVDAKLAVESGKQETARKVRSKI